MSDDLSEGWSEFDPSTGTHRTADDIVRTILDDHASSSTELSPTGELYRAIERFRHRTHTRPSLVSSARRDLLRSHLNRRAASTASDMPEHLPPRPNMSRRPSEASPPRRLSTEPQLSASGALPPLRLTESSRSPATPAITTVNRPGITSRRRVFATGASRSRGTNPGSTNIVNHYNSMTTTARSGQQGHRRARWDPNEQYDDQGSRAEETSRYWRSLLDLTSSEATAGLFISQERLEESRRAKRRKLDLERITDFKGFRYGRYGQVEPGDLTMELVSCDGGMFAGDYAQNYAAENILKNDTAVYCTKGPRCNIVLRHQGSTVFSLKELVIKAPRHNYTSPVQEGMVFITMDADELFARTTQYQIEYLAPTSRGAEGEAQDLTPITSTRHEPDGRALTSAQVRARRLYNLGMEEEENDFRVAHIPPEFNAAPPPFQVTTDCSDDEADNSNSRAGRRAPDRIGHLPFESDDDEEGDLLDDELGLTSGSGSIFQLAEYRPRRRRNRSRSALAEAAASGRTVSEELQVSTGVDLLAPHARFYIESSKSKCTIKFDPPVSGRFILLKMWSPHRSLTGNSLTGNIDIQAVVARGFAGPRYFPSVVVR